MVMYQQNNLEKLHERDFNLWAEQMTIAVQNQDLNAINNSFISLEKIFQKDFFV
ncbi:MAG: hypothetical protein ACRC8K_11480 [Waterburya sp.]